MTKLPLFSLPYASSGAARDPVVSNEVRGLVLALVWDHDGQMRKSEVLFLKPRAYRQRNEIYCTAWHIDEAYDTICEVNDSNWVAELRDDAVPEWREYWVMRHFMIYVDSFGCLEVIADSAVLDSNIERNSGGT